jgi:primary-amine oxidase
VAAKTGQPAVHPLHPLTAEEIERAVAEVRKQKSLGESWRFVSLALAEPNRPAVVTPQSPNGLVRTAAVLVMDTATGQSFEAVVDLSSGDVTKYEPPPATLASAAPAPPSARRSSRRSTRRFDVA